MSGVRVGDVSSTHSANHHQARDLPPESVTPARLQLSRRGPDDRVAMLSLQGALTRARVHGTPVIGDSAPRATAAVAARIDKPPVSQRYKSPNFSERTQDINRIVLHHTAGSNLAGAIDALTDPNNPRGKVSAHYVIDKDGTIYQLVPDDKVAFHKIGRNADSIGIEIVNRGDGRDRYTPQQYRALERLVPYLAQRYDVPLRNLEGHRPGEPSGNFDFDRIRDAVRRGGGNSPAPPERPPAPPPENRPPQQQPPPQQPPPTRPPMSRLEAPTADLGYGERGSQVLKLQRALTDLGYMTRAQVATGPGRFGPRTLAAVREFQRDNQLAVDGVYGPQTRAALRRRLNDTTPTAPAANLRRGDHGPQVRELQAALVRLGHLTPAEVRTGPGHFGPRTQDAVQEFQRRHDLVADGIYGPRTRAALRGALGEARPERPDGPERPREPRRPPDGNGPGRIDSPGDLADVRGSGHVSREFKEKVIRIADRLGMNPNHLMAIMSFETGGTFSPSERNRAGSGAVGLIQFLPSTARGLGTTTGELSRMSAERQLDFVEKYLRPYKGRMDTVEDAYMAVFYPAAIGKDNNHVLFRRGGAEYDQNAGLDRNRDGAVRKGEAAREVRAILESATEARPPDRTERPEPQQDAARIKPYDVRTPSGGRVRNYDDLTPHHDYQRTGLGEVHDFTLNHPGRADIGLPIPSPMRGRVIFAGVRGGYGNAVIVEDGKTGAQYLIGHMQGIRVKVGQRIEYGHVIGSQGSTGNSTGPHLHLEAPAWVGRRYIRDLNDGVFERVGRDY